MSIPVSKNPGTEPSSPFPFFIPHGTFSGVYDPVPLTQSPKHSPSSRISFREAIQNETTPPYIYQFTPRWTSPIKRFPAYVIIEISVCHWWNILPIRKGNIRLAKIRFMTSLEIGLFSRVSFIIRMIRLFIKKCPTMRVHCPLPD